MIMISNLYKYFFRAQKMFDQIDSSGLRIHYTNVVNKRHKVNFEGQNLATLLKPTKENLASISEFDRELLMKLLVIETLEQALEFSLKVYYERSYNFRKNS